mmetsp:Transcript_31993/g.83716  ORF Transcript_31993/g.83716 Transcript_31993/m.83716 type:complete len:722 (+) Transcript_31993:90-2255(+)
MGCSSSKMSAEAPRSDVRMYDVPETPPPSAPAPLEINFAQHTKTLYGKCRFMGTVAEGYLKAQGLPIDTLSSPNWTSDSAKTDKVAKAIVEWAKDNGATMATHIFQPLASGGLRFGQTGMVQNAMFNFNSKGECVTAFSGDELVQGETDGSSYQNGGLRATHTAGGYTSLDPTSPIFIRGDTVFIPTVFVSWHGTALDEKTPLLKSMRTVSVQGKRLMKLLGWEVNGIIPNIGLEQEFFLIPRSAYYKRPDLQMAGRTVMGRSAPRGQEMCDHYMAPLNQVALACMQEIMHEGFKMGCPFKTRHREVAPNQYECAPYFGIASTQIDENLTLMQLIEEIPQKHGLVGILNEKPFNGVNGSGKHNNFSIGTPDGVNLLNVEDVTKASGSPETFAVIMSAIVEAVNKHGDLMRMSIASPGNDFRLGACEAPPAIISTYLGDQLTGFLEAFKSGTTGQEYAPAKKDVNLGIDGVATIRIPAEDRNRTSPFPYGGHRFEFRAAGSSQNVSMINTVLCTTIGESFKIFADKIEAGEKAVDVAAAALTDSWKVIFNGNGYSEEWPIEAGKRGVWRIDSGVEACQCLSSDKNTKLFEDMGVMTKAEALARTDIMHDHYAGTVEIEAKCMVDMIQQHVLPSANKAGAKTASKLEAAIQTLESAITTIEKAESSLEKAKLSRVLRLETMIDIRKICDDTEAVVPPAMWTLATYKELLFLDFEQGARAGMVL